MNDRTHLIAAFLRTTPYAAWDQTPIAGDASARRYLRLCHGDDSVIVMDDPAGSTAPFAMIATHLRAHGLSAPKVLAHDADNGLMLISDLGPDDYATTLRTGSADEATLYRAAADVLIRLRDVANPPTLTKLTPQRGAEMIGILGTHYTRSSVDDLMAEILPALTAHAPNPTTLALRDYHAENLIWRSDRSGLDRVGLLDFQDAFVAPEGYDLASLLRDARRDVPEAIVQDTINYYIAEMGQPDTFRTQLAVLGIQRNLRIMGVFARLARNHGKTRYLAFMPRVWDYILRDLKDPALIRLSDLIHHSVPAPTPSVLRGLQP